MISAQTDTTYWNDICGVFRWDPVLCTRPGTYRVVALAHTFDLIVMGQKEIAGWDHPTCVVDDFGTLVKVPA